MRLLLAACLIFVAGCGAADRFVVSMTGDAIVTCHDEVTYLQFTSGASVAYNKDGSIKVCD